MKITAIKQQARLQNRYSVYVNDKYAFSLSESALLASQLHSGIELSREQLADYTQVAKDDKAYGLTLAYVARRPRSTYELNVYFRKKGYEEPVRASIIERLEGLGLVNDRQFAESWVSSRRLLKPVSRRRLTQELQQKKIPESIINEVLADDETTDRDTLRALITRKQRQLSYQDPNKLMQFLARQGYRYDDIKAELGDTRSSS
jgi:regulatory protein